MRRWTLIATPLGLAVTVLDETVVFVALTAVAHDLGSGLLGQPWIVNAYLLPLAALLLPAGALADRLTPPSLPGRARSIRCPP